MGANASTAVPLYASGQVLDAARLNLTNAGIPVFGGTALRDAAFGGSGEKVLAEGQFCYLEDSDTTQFYSGSSWQAVATTPGMTLIASASYTSATSFTISSCFTSTYRNYRLIFDSSGNNATCTAQLLVGATPTTSGYNYQTFEASSTTLTGARAASQSSFLLGPLSNGGQIDLTIYRPKLTLLTGLISFGSYGGSFSTAQPTIAQSTGNQDTSTAFDGITITGAASGLTGKYCLYGLAE